MIHVESQLEQQFHSAMLGIYEAALELSPPYRATRFLRMVNEHGGLATAQTLLATDTPSDGFTELFLRGKRLDLSVEYLVLTAPYGQLFSPAEIATARERLAKHDFPPPAPHE